MSIAQRVRESELAPGPCCERVGMSIEASQLGWQPGFWPIVLEVQGEGVMVRAYHRGQAIRGHGDGLAAIEYVCEDGSSVLVLND